LHTRRRRRRNGLHLPTGKLAAEGAAAKVKGALTPKPSEIELPPGTDK
jgi:hypothetical protein